jgi:hypothetical protein
MIFCSAPKRGYFLIPAPGDSLRSYRHALCGVERHNICPNCRRPLLRVLTLDTRDPRLELNTTTVGSLPLPLLFCWRCNVSQGPFYYRLLSEPLVELLIYNRGGVEADFPYPDYPDYFPESPVTLAAIPPDVQERLVKINEGEIDDMQLGRPRHQIGGIPYLFQYEPERQSSCAVCHAPMPFLATICDDNGDARGFTENSGVQMLFRYCRRCCVVLAYQQCD